MLDLKSIIPWERKNNVPVKRENDADPFTSFRREMDRVFDDFFNGFGGRSMLPAKSGWQGVTPSLDVSETDKELVVTAELPGLDEKDFEVTLTSDVLTIKGEKKAEHEEKDGDTTYVERHFGSFSRSVRLPFEVGDDNVEANYDKGVLKVRIPKPKEVQESVRRIDVKAA